MIRRILSGLALLLVFGCASKGPDEVILSVGGEPVSVDAFRLRYELDPAFPGIRKGPDGLRDYLNRMADEKLALHLARQEGLLTHPEFAGRVRSARELALVRALYREEVESRITVSEAEKKEAFEKSKTRLHVRHIFAPDKRTLSGYQKRLRAGEAFDSVARDAFQGIRPQQGGSDLGWVSWGDLDPGLEEAAFNLDIMKYSDPVRSAWGYHILQVVSRQDERILTQEDYAREAQSLTQKIRRRKAEAASGAYLKTLLDPLDIRIKPGAFQAILEALHLSSDARPGGFMGGAAPPLTDEKIERMRTRLAPRLKESFMESRDAIWTVGDFLNRLSDLPVHRRPHTSSRQAFYEKTGVIIRNHFLALRAKERGLLKSPVADSTFQSEAGQLFYWHYLEKIGRSRPVPDEVKQYYASKENPEQAAGRVPETVLPGMSRLKDWALFHARQALHAHLLNSNPEIGVTIDEELLRRESARIDWNRPVRMLVTQIP